MKPVFRCEYCNFMGIEEVVKEHEKTCSYNASQRDCESCKHANLFKHINFNNPSKNKIECEKGKDVPIGQKFINCDLHEKRDPKYSSSGIVTNPFNFI